MARSQATTRIPHSGSRSSRTLAELLPELSPKQAAKYDAELELIEQAEREAAQAVWTDTEEPIGEDYPAQSASQKP